jgi:glyoxylase-like metal-dependent hydrolase (beta-lactamase superfamily II)
MVIFESGSKSAAFVADLMPTAAHAPDLWTTSYDLYPMETLAAKQQFAREAIDRGTIVLFEHDPAIAAGYLRETNGKRVVQPA